MAVITMSADSTTLTLNGTLINDLVSGDVLTLAPVNPLTSHVNAKNGGVTIQKRADGDVHDLTIRVHRNSESDVFMNSAVNSDQPTVFNGSMKENFNRDGTDGVETWTLANGSITTRPTATMNDQDGNALSEYVIRFRSTVRAL